MLFSCRLKIILLAVTPLSALADSTALYSYHTYSLWWAVGNQISKTPVTPVGSTFYSLTSRRELLKLVIAPAGKVVDHSLNLRQMYGV